MKKVSMVALMLLLGAGSLQPLRAKDGFLGGGIYASSDYILPTVRFGFEDTYLFDFGLSFSTVKTSNFTLVLKGLDRFTEIDDVRIHGGALIGIGEVANTTAVQFSVLLGAEAPISDTFSVTADIAPISSSADGETEALFRNGAIGMNLYFK